MTDGLPDSLRSAFASHDAFEPVEGRESPRPADDADAAETAFSVADHEEGDRYAVTTTPFEATVGGVEGTGSGSSPTVDVLVTPPSLDAAVAGETVADVVEEGWFETLELRLADVYEALELTGAADPAVDLDGDRVRAAFSFEASAPSRAADDAKAVVDFVEGTYVQGVIPGYEYADPVAGLIERATEHADGEGEGARRGGTPL